eukprot:6076284-Prymnesium_polylepis.2
MHVQQAATVGVPPTAPNGASACAGAARLLSVSGTVDRPGLAPDGHAQPPQVRLGMAEARAAVAHHCAGPRRREHPRATPRGAHGVPARWARPA